MKHNHIYLIVVFVISLSFTSNAQELNQDVKVVREYNPIISDAFKINKLPVEEVDSSTFNPDFSYEILSKAMTSALAIEPITAARLQPERKTVLDKSYVKGGVGNYVTLFGELNYNILRSEEYALGLNVGHISSDGDIKLEDDQNVSAPFHDTWSSLYFRRFWDDYTLSIDADFKHNIYNYYGFQTIDPLASYTETNFGTIVSGSDLMADKRQRQSSFGVNVGFGNKVVDFDDVSFKSQLNWNTFGNVTGVGENNFGLHGKVNIPLDNMYLDLTGGFDYYGTTIPDSISPLYYFLDQNKTLINFSPLLGFVFEGVDLKVGMDIYSQLGGIEDEFNIAPHIEADLVIADGIVTAFGGLKGDYYVNNYQKIQQENPFVAVDEDVKNSFHGIHLFGGIKGNFSSQTSFVARVDYSIFNDEHFYVNRAFESNVPETTGIGFQVHQTNIFDVIYDDGSLLSVSGELKYEPSKELNILFRGKYNGWNLDNFQHAWHKPEVELGVAANFSPFSDFWINANLNTLGKRYAYDPSTMQAEELKSVIDFNMGAEYLLSSKWTLFANLNNVFISKYYQWYGYPMQGLNIRAGVGYSF